MAQDRGILDGMYGEEIVFTGILKDTREELRRLVREHGGRFANHISQHTTILVVGEQNHPTVVRRGESGKVSKAKMYREAGQPILIISAKKFYRAIDEWYENPNKRSIFV